MTKLAISVTYKFDVDDETANKIKELFEMASNPLQDCNTHVRVIPNPTKLTDPENQRGRMFMKLLSESVVGKLLIGMSYDLR